MKDLIARTRELFAEGMPLAKMVDGRLSVDLEMFSRGRSRCPRCHRSHGYDTLHNRPAISKVKQAGLLGRALFAYLAGLDRKSEKSGRIPVTLRPERSVRETRVVLEDSYSECHRIARASSSNFYAAFFLLPDSKRDALAALYAFMRLVDDVADEGADLAAKQRGLAKWRAALDQAITGEAQLFDGNAAVASRRKSWRCHNHLCPHSSILCGGTKCRPAIFTISSAARKWI